jgi:hypothetical protein
MPITFLATACTRFGRETILLLTLLAATLQGRSAETAFTYQGRLNALGQAASGVYDFRFILYSADVGGNQVGNIVTIPSVTVSSGLFATVLDFGAGAFDGNPRWLDIAVRTNGGVDFTPLTPRQALSPTPYAIYSANANQAQTAASLTGPLPANQLSGTISTATLADGSVTWPKLAPGTISRLTNPTGSATNLVVTSSGFVGINTVAPAVTLDVAGSVRTPNLIVSGSGSVSGSLTVQGTLYSDGVGRFLDTVYAGSTAFGTTNALEVTGSARVRTNLFVNADLFVGDDIVIGSNKGNVRSDSATQLKVGFTSGSFIYTASAGGGVDIDFIIPSFPAGTTASQVRVQLSQFLPDAGSGLGFQQYTMTVYSLDIPNRLCTVRLYNAGGASATIDGTLYLMTIGPAE